MLRHKLIYFDDQVQNIECFSNALTEEFNVIGSSDPREYKVILEMHKPLALMIDLHMPFMNGFELYDKITESLDYNGCPVLFISGDQSDESRITAIKNGAVDYLERNLPIEEVKLRLVSRVNHFLKGAASLELGNLRMDTKIFQTYINDKPIELTLVETRILSLLLRSPKRSVSKQEVIEKVWGEPAKSGKIFTHLSNLGSKLWDWDFEIKVKGDTIAIHSCQ